jgi:uncharacterized protein
MIQAVWIEIPVKDLDRVLAFYQKVFELGTIDIGDDGVRRTCTLTNTEGNGVGISLNQTANFEPSDKGILVYLDTGEDLADHLNRVEPAGGQVVESKTSMGGAGWYATVKDTEGNLFALYSLP